MKRPPFFLFILKATFIVGLCLTQFQTSAKLLNSEQRTVKAGLESMQWLQYLHSVSKICNDSEYLSLAPLQEFEAMVQERLKISLENFQVFAEENDQYVEVLDIQLSRLNCEEDDVKDLLAFIYSEYDIAKFKFELNDPIEKPLLTKIEVANKNEQALKDYIKEKASIAETIFIAELIRGKDAPSHYQKSVKKSDFKPKEIYQITQGWKKPIKRQFVTPPMQVTLDEDSVKQQKLLEDKGKTTVLVFIKNPKYSFSTYTIIGTVNLDLYPADISFLGAPEWQWMGKRLIE